MISKRARGAGLALGSLIWLGVAPGGALAQTPRPSAPERAAERFAHAGPYRVRVLPSALCCDRRGHSVDVFLPEGASDRAMPLVSWGNGTGASPDQYAYVLRHLASWGLVVVATRDRATGDGGTLDDAIALAERAGSLPPIDRSRVAAIGHSQGASGALETARGRHLRTVIAIAHPQRRFCGRGDCEGLDGGLDRRTSLLLLSGDRDGLSGPDSDADYFDAAGPVRLKVRAGIRGGDHNDIQGTPGCGFLQIGCRRGVQPLLGYVTAWLAWQLSDDRQARAVFVGETPAIYADDSLTAVEVSSNGRHHAAQGPRPGRRLPAFEAEGFETLGGAIR